MQATRMIAVLACLGVLLLAGCEQEVSYRDNTPPPNTSQQERGTGGYMAGTSVSRESGAPSPSAVEDALEWSRKYSQTAEKLAETQRDYNELEREKQQLLAQIARLQTELDRAKKELHESNDMLIEMREELNSWKTNVLGYRDEMRKAQQVQIDRLEEIIKLLGGQVGPRQDDNAAESEDREGRQRDSAS